MQECVKRGCETPGVLPGGYKVKRRAPEVRRRLEEYDSVRTIHMNPKAAAPALIAK